MKRTVDYFRTDEPESSASIFGSKPIPGTFCLSGYPPSGKGDNVSALGLIPILSYICRLSEIRGKKLPRINDPVFLFPTPCFYERGDRWYHLALCEARMGNESAFRRETLEVFREERIDVE